MQKEKSLFTIYIYIYVDANCRRNLIFLILDEFLSFSCFLFFCFFVQFGNKVVAQAACDVFQLLISHWERLQRFDQSMPKKTIEVTETTQTCKIIIN